MTQQKVPLQPDSFHKSAHLSSQIRVLQYFTMVLAKVKRSENLQSAFIMGLPAFKTHRTIGKYLESAIS